METAPALNSALYWFPRIAHLRVPETRFVQYDHAVWVSVMESRKRLPEFDKVLAATVEKVASVADELGYPLFVRSDLASAKHQGPDSYLIRDPEGIRQVLWATVEDNEVKFWLERAQPAAFMLRQFLDLQSGFEAFGGHPIAREWRYFVRDDKVVCRHFYWTEDAMRFHGAEPPKWKEALTELEQYEPPPELATRAEEAGAVCVHYNFWSVDFAQDKQGAWWLIDMATGERSWHPECSA